MAHQKLTNRTAIWLTFPLLAALSSACGADAGPDNAAAEGGAGAQPGTGGASGGGGGIPSMGGGGTAAVCENGLKVLATDSSLSAVQSVSGTSAVLARNGSSFALFHDLSSLQPGGVPEARRFTAQDLGFEPQTSLREVEVLGDELFALTEHDVLIGNYVYTIGKVVLTPPIEDPLLALAVDHDLVVVSSSSEFAVATRKDRAWTWGTPQPFPTSEVPRDSRFLGVVNDELFFGLHEALEASDPRTWLAAELVRTTLDGQVTGRFPARGNPASVMPSDGGLLIGEQNSFWGSLQAALEWLPSGGTELQTLTRVPVRSSSDGTDGAFATTLLDTGADSKVLYVANGESKLRRTTWALDRPEAMTLEPVLGPWDSKPESFGMVTHIASSGDVLVLPGIDSKLYFLRACSD